MGTVPSFARVLTAVWKPQYVLRPTQLLRLLRTLLGTPPRIVTLPWGLAIACDPQEEIGRGLTRLGMYDLPVTEVVMRLADSGEIAIDAGANIGYMSSLLLCRVGHRGRVLAFEPHPDIVQELRDNAARWPARLIVNAVALSDRTGTALMDVGAHFPNNRGTARIATSETSDSTLSVAVTTIDDVLRVAGIERVGVMKVDVEGHELPLLRGALNSLRAHRIRDVVFEDPHSMPSEAATLLRSAGYSVFGISSSFFGPKLLTAEEMNHRRDWEPGNYVATTEPLRAQTRLKRRGWITL